MSNAASTSKAPHVGAQAIEAPIIGGLIVAAATTVASIVTNAFQAVKGASPLACGVVNNTPYKLKRFTGIWQPVHGEQQTAPAPEVVSLLQGAAKSGNAWTEENNTAWALTSRGSGTEVLTVFQFVEIPLTISLYAGNPVTGAPYAGVSVGDNSWFMNNFNGHSDDRHGNWMIDHIKSIHTKNCQYSENARPCIAQTTDELIKVEFASAEKTIFYIGFTGDWSKFPMPKG